MKIAALRSVRFLVQAPLYDLARAFLSLGVRPTASGIVATGRILHAFPSTV